MCMVWYRYHTALIFFLLLLFFYDRQSSPISLTISLCVRPTRGNARRWRREAEVEAEERGGGRGGGGEERWRRRREVDVEQRCRAIVLSLGRGGSYPADHNMRRRSWGEEEEVPHSSDEYGDVGPFEHPEPTIKSKAYNKKNGNDTMIKIEDGDDE